jgi:hypothetical protein
MNINYNRHLPWSQSEHAIVRALLRAILMALFYPTETYVPDRLQADDYFLRPLTVDDVKLDYAALMGSKEMLRRWGGRDWPADDFTLDENFKDLEEHQREHLERVAFTYTVMHARWPECLGCVYLDPLERVLALDRAGNGGGAPVGDFLASVRFWVTEPNLASGMDRRLLEALIAWFDSEWAFSEMYFRANERDGRQVKLFVEAGFGLRYRVDPEDVQGCYLLFGPLKLRGRQ